MTLKRTLFASGLALLAACGEGETPTAYDEEDQGDGDIIALPPGGDDELGAGEEVVTQTSEAEEEPRAAISDTLGRFEGAVTGLAIWEHPSLSFESAILAANGEAGLAVVPVDSEIALTAIEGVFDGGVAVGYGENGDSLVAAASGEDVILFTVDDERGFEPAGVLEDVGGGTAALCMVGTTLLRAASTGVTVHALSVEDGGIAEERTDLELTGLGCAATEDRFFVQTGATTVVALGADGGGQEADISLPGEAYAALGGIAAIAEAPGRGTVIASTESGQLVGVRYPFGGESPTAAVTPTRAGAEDLGGVEALAAGSGNFGSVYRDGVVAFVDGEGRLKLLPWAGLARAFGFEAATSRSIRSPGAAQPGPQMPAPSADPE